MSKLLDRLLDGPDWSGETYDRVLVALIVVMYTMAVVGLVVLWTALVVEIA